MSKVSSNGCCSNGCDNENKFVIMVDDTDCSDKHKSCGPVQGIPIQTVFIDLSDCMTCKSKNDKCKEEKINKK